MTVLPSTAELLPAFGAAPSGAAPAAPARSRAYFFSAPVDFMLMGGASILAYLGFKLFHSGARDLWVIALAANLTWVCNWPHFAATSLRLYRSRATMAQYPMTAFLTPLLMLGGIAASLSWPAVFAPYFLLLYAIWSPYHFSGQTVGITMVYARRTGTTVSALERRVLGAFIFSTFAFPMLGANESLGGFQEGPVVYPSFHVSHGFVQAGEAWMTATAVAWLALIAWRSWKERRLVHPLFILPALTQFVWFVAGSETASFQEFVPFFHSLQYLVIAFSLQMKERLDATAGTPGGRFLTKETLRWGALIAALGALLFYGLPRLVSSLTGVEIALAITVVQTGVQLHHFLVDGIIWKLRHKSVASPLAVTIHDLIGH